MEKIQIISDTDFISSFLKIDRMDLILKSFEIERITITNAVLQEIKRDQVYQKYLKDKHKIELKKVEFSKKLENFGAGESESIALAKKSNSLLLMSDKKAINFSKNLGLKVIDIPTFLFYCKENNILSLKQLKQIVIDLREKDKYEFSKEARKKLLNQ